jgi:hypothetical protein
MCGMAALFALPAVPVRIAPTWNLDAEAFH